MASKKRSHYPVNYRSCRKLKAKYYTENVDLVSEDELVDESFADNRAIVQSHEEEMTEEEYVLVIILNGLPCVM